MKKLLFIICLIFGVGFLSIPAYAIDSPICDHPEWFSPEAFEAAGCGIQENLKDSPKVASALNIVFFAIGLLSVGILIYGGIRYILAQGLTAELSAAQHTIIYGVIGLVVSLSGWAIVQLVVNNL